MIDIHTHLYFPQYDADRDETIKRAFDAGMEIMISVGTEPDDWEKVLSITQKDTRIRAAIGMHPHFFNENGIEDIEAHIQNLKERVISHQDVMVAIGECGLDYYSHTSEAVTDEQKVWQKQGFIEQLKVADELRLPVIIHCRDAYEDVVDILAEYPDLKCILHCYMGDTVVTEKFLALPNVYFSFTGNITYQVKKMLEGTKDDIRETVKLVPVERVFTETDCPFLAPVPYRGKRNEPVYVSEVIKKIAELKGCSSDVIVKAVSKNKSSVFLWGEV